MNIHIRCRTIGHLKRVKEMFEKHGTDDYSRMVDYCWNKYQNKTVVCFNTQRGGWWSVGKAQKKSSFNHPNIYLEFSNNIENRFEQLLKEEK